MQKNGQMWYDTDGNEIQAHGGCIINYEGTYYWYGENKNGITKNRRMDFIGFSCYSSKDLVNWKNEGLAFKAITETADHEAGIKSIGERPKVVYSKKINKFVMWWHLDNMQYDLSRAAYALSDNPTGPFIYVKSFKPNVIDMFDFTVFVDNDEKAYLVHASDRNKTMVIAELNDEYTAPTGNYKKIFTDQIREAPVMYHADNGMYYLATSSCTGYDPNSMLYAISRNNSIFGLWVLLDNPCMGREDYRKTFQGQGTYPLYINGKYYIMLDHWNPNDIKSSGYSILPVKFDKTYMEVMWQDEWKGIQ
ncbi:MAG: glycosyl hydrolase family 43 [Ruminococcaceae bacterium]|nr:glycosyl hydrolase family 43 [Oscillospiraceae bacterium]